MTIPGANIKKAGAAGLSLQKLFKEYGFIFILLVVTLMFAALEPSFLSATNLIGILYQVSIIGIMAVCSTFVLITGGVDLSVGPIMALAGVLAAFTLEATGQALLPALLVGVLTGVAVGFINGLAVARFNLPAIVVTLAMMSIVRGAALLAGGAVLHLIREPESFLFIGSGRLFGLPFPIYIFATAAVVMLFIQMRTRFGLSVFAIGENREAARLCGLPVIKTRTVVYVISGIGAAIAGLILASQVHTASATYGNGIELDVIAAIVLGGTSLRGGSGSVARSVLGALLIGVINNGLSILNVSIELQLVVKGLIIIVGLALDNYLKSEEKS